MEASLDSLSVSENETEFFSDASYSAEPASRQAHKWRVKIAVLLRLVREVQQRTPVVSHALAVANCEEGLDQLPLLRLKLIGFDPNANCARVGSRVLSREDSNEARAG